LRTKCRVPMDIPRVLLLLPGTLRLSVSAVVRLILSQQTEQFAREPSAIFTLSAREIDDSCSSLYIIHLLRVRRVVAFLPSALALREAE
jgi:hypothetical protein